MPPANAAGLPGANGFRRGAPPGPRRRAAPGRSPGENAKQFTHGRKSLTGLHQAVVDVPGLGDQAYFASDGSGKRETNTLAARKGPIAVFLTAPKPLGAERSLMTQLLGKL